MGSYNPAIPCCCDGQNLCCLSLTFEQLCQTTNIDVQNCTTIDGPIEVVTYSKEFRTCVTSEEECNCELLSNPQDIDGFGQIPPGGTVVDCSATYYPNIRCDSLEAEEACAGGDTVCINYKCGPCGPVRDGCVTVDSGTPCPPIPNCGRDPCCDTPPTQLCCRRVISGACIVSANCEVCTEETSSGTGVNGEISIFVPNCEGCNLDTGFLITTLCCSTCSYVDTDVDGFFETLKNACVESGQQPDLTTCCSDCSTVDPVTGDIDCLFAACLFPCAAGVSPPNICACPIAPTGYECFLFTQPTFRYGTASNSAEGNFMSGMIYDPVTKTYRQNRLFLFGYGYDKL